MPEEDDDDELCGCDLDFTDHPTTDEELPYVILFATIDEDYKRRGLLGKFEHHRALQNRADEWIELFTS